MSMAVYGQPLSGLTHRKASALSTLNFTVATVARPWDSRTLVSAAILVLSVDKALVGPN
jgi:hypothetical protein